jgi:hypothetical protein
MSFIFLYGRPGSGKTTLAASMVKLGLKVRFVDIDDKVRMMVNLKPYLDNGMLQVTTIKAKLSQTNLREAIMTPKVGLARQPQGYLEFCDIITGYEDLIAEGKDLGEQVLVVDSTTSMTEHMKRLIAHLQGKSHFTYDEWAIVLSNFEQFFDTMKGLLKSEEHTGFEHVIIIAHETTERDEITGKIETLPFIEGQTRYKVGKYFEEVYYCMVDVPRAGEPNYKVLTVAGERYTARTSRDLPTYVISDFSVIFAKKESPVERARRLIKEKKNGEVKA